MYRWRCNCQVWDQLSVRDMARAAGACREFAQRVQHARSTLRTLKVPAGACSFNKPFHAKKFDLSALFIPMLPGCRHPALCRDILNAVPNVD